MATSSPFRPTVHAAIAVTSIAALDLTVITAALPVIVREVGAESDAATVVAAHLATSAIAVAAVGPVSDVVGRHRLTIGSLAVLSSGLLATALAPSLVFLLLARALAGVGSGALLTLAQARVAAEIPSRDRGRAQGHVIAAAGIATAAGPAFGGVLVSLVGWRGTFLLQLPLVAVALLTLTRTRGVDGSVGEGGRLDPRALLLLVTALTGVIGGLQLTVTERVPIPLGVLIMGSGVTAGAAFTRGQRHATAPLVHLTALVDRSVQVAFAIGAATNGALYLLVVLLPLLLQGPLGLTPALAGVAQLPLLTAFVLTAAIVGRRLSKVGQVGRLAFLGGLALTFGFGMTTAAAALTSTATPITAVTALLLVGAALAGAGTGAIYPTLLIAAQNVTATQHLGAVTGLLAFGRQIGALLSLAIAGVYFARAPSSSYLLVSMVGLGFAVVTTAIAQHLPDKQLATRLPDDTEAVRRARTDRPAVIDITAIGGLGRLLPAGRLLIAAPPGPRQRHDTTSRCTGTPPGWIDVSRIELATPPDTADPVTAGIWLARAVERSGPELAALLAAPDLVVRPIGLTGGRTGGRAALLGVLLVGLQEASVEALTDAWPQLSGHRPDIWGHRATIDTMLRSLITRHGSIGGAIDAFGLDPGARHALAVALFGPD